MAIPSGYRLLTSSDVGKTFGVELESVVYFDTSVTPNAVFSANVNTNLTNFIKSIYVFLDPPDAMCNAVSLGTKPSQPIFIYRDNVYSSSDTPWEMDSYTFTESLEITSYYTDTNWNNFFYVKDITDPYNITLTKPKLTVECADMTMEKDLVVQATVYDGTVEGGEAGSGITPTGTLEITENGTYDVTNYASANVNVASSGGGVNFNLRVSGSGFDYTNVKVEYSLDGADFVEFNNGQYGSTINLTGSCIILYVEGYGSIMDYYTGTNLLFDVNKNGDTYRGYRPESNETIILTRVYD